MIDFIKYYYYITDSKLPNDKNNSVPKTVTKKNRFFMILFHYFLFLLSLVTSVLLVVLGNNYFLLFLPLLFYFLLYFNCNFSLILCVILFIKANMNNQYNKVLYSHYHKYNFANELVKMSNGLIKSCNLYSELHKTLFTVKYKVDIKRSNYVFLTVKHNKIIVDYLHMNYCINEKFKDVESLLNKLILILKEL